MRVTRRLLPAFLAVLALSVGLPASVSPVRADDTAQLEAQRAQLLQQLAAITAQQPAATSALNQAEAAYGQAASQLGLEQGQLAALNSQLATLSGGITSDETQEAAAKSALAALTRATYESVSGNSVMTAVLSARDFTAAMDSLSGAASVTTQIEGLEATLTSDQTNLLTQQRELQTDFAQASSIENELSVQTNQMLTIVYQRDQAVNALDGPARQLAEEIAQIDNELSGNSVVPSGGSCSNSFAYGECTWYVATQRCIPWGGNADAWYYNAAKAGYLEGNVPEVGAVAVWWAGAGGASWVGHVAYVTDVGPDAAVPAGWFEVAEMNWNGWDQVDYRVVEDDPNVFQGFIYGPGPA